MVREAQPDSLLEWYRNDVYGTTDCREVEESIEKYYLERKKNISLEAIEERFRNDQRVNQCDMACEYRAYLEDLQYVCRAERDRLASEVREAGGVGSGKKEELCAFLQERRKLIAELGTNKRIDIGEDKEEWVVDGEWDRGQVMCALQIEVELNAAGFEREFVIGLIGNVKAEGRFGKLEKTDHSGDHEHWDHVNDCIDYFHVYSDKQVTELDLVKLYVDMVYKKSTGECKNDELHYFGMGAVQWTNTRCEKLMELYLQEAGLDTESAEFQTMVQNCQQDKPYEGVYLTEEQVWVAEVKMFKHELTEDKTYKKVYPSYRSECRGGHIKED